MKLTIIKMQQGMQENTTIIMQKLNPALITRTHRQMHIKRAEPYEEHRQMHVEHATLQEEHRLLSLAEGKANASKRPLQARRRDRPYQAPTCL